MREQTALRFDAPPRPRARPVSGPARPLGVVAQVRRACAPGNRLGAFVGLLLGSFVPVAVFVIAHQESGTFTGHERAWTLVFGGLAYSATTVFQWARLAFTSAFKSVGFVLLLEGTMITSQTRWLALVALAYLVGINSVATACTLGGQR